jgi:alanine dehydrogenase
MPAAVAFTQEMTATLCVRVYVLGALADGTRRSGIVVTCTPARVPLLGLDDLAPGTFVAAIGADSPEKQELDPRILARATVVTDITAQCARVGELHHAIAAGLMRETDVHAELGEIIAGRKPGRRTADDLVVYDATGTALQDTACAATIYRKAVEQGGSAFRSHLICKPLRVMWLDHALAFHRLPGPLPRVDTPLWRAYICAHIRRLS